MSVKISRGEDSLAHFWVQQVVSGSCCPGLDLGAVIPVLSGKQHEK